uniref:Condensin complex subunit 2 n=1 Tax=Davidia involucrata TaxID=16924 RepID=A0A5B7B5P1_DAVIN
MFVDQFDDGNGHSDVEHSDTLVSQPRQVNKIEVQYDRTSKQVDVQALKETLWDHIQLSSQMSVQGQEETTSFRHVLASFPNDRRAAAAVEDISPHLCFICLLHLANEHGLSIHGCANLDDLSIHLSP